MRRRAFLAGVGAATTAGLAGCGAVERIYGSGGDSEDVTRVTVSTIDARGSDSGEITVPVEGSPTLVDAFATWCSPCKPALDNLAAAREQVGSDVVFVSSTNEPLTDDFGRADIAEWWADHGGEWTVAHDGNDSELFRELGRPSIPTAVLFDAAGQEAWRHTGIPETETVVAEIQSVTG
jgi:thiol-disulfide isomerase/thioredoxin